MKLVTSSMAFSILLLACTPGQTVVKTASKDLKCAEGQVIVETERTGAYSARGCGKAAYYSARCLGAECTVSAGSAPTPRQAVLALASVELDCQIEGMRFGKIEEHHYRIEACGKIADYETVCENQISCTAKREASAHDKLNAARKRAELDLRCSKDQLEARMMSPRVVVVQACEKQATYLMSCVREKCDAVLEQLREAGKVTTGDVDPKTVFQ